MTNLEKSWRKLQHKIWKDNKNFITVISWRQNCWLMLFIMHKHRQRVDHLLINLFSFVNFTKKSFTYREALSLCSSALDERLLLVLVHFFVWPIYKKTGKTTTKKLKRQQKNFITVTSVLITYLLYLLRSICWKFSK